MYMHKVRHTRLSIGAVEKLKHKQMGDDCRTLYCKPNLLQAYLNNGDALVVLWSAAPVIQA